VVLIVLNRYRVKEAIKRWMMLRTPGLYESIEPVCLRDYKKSCLDLFLDEPDKFRELLVMQFRDQNYIYFLIRYTIIRPLLKELRREELEEELATDFINDIDKFKSIFRDATAAA